MKTGGDHQQRKRAASQLGRPRVSWSIAHRILGILAIVAPFLLTAVARVLPSVLKPRTVFMIYPGQWLELRAYCPGVLLPVVRTRLVWSRPVPVGAIMQGWRPVGMVTGVPNTQKELVRHREDVAIIQSRLIAFSRKIGARRVSMAGQLPGILKRHGLKRDPMIVAGVFGTVFLVSSCIRRIFTQHDLSDRAQVTIFGVGMIGSSLIGHLSSEGFNVVGIDQSPRTNDTPGLSEAITILGATDVAVLLSSRGVDFLPYVEFLKKGAVVLDDTHPSFPINRMADVTVPPGVQFYKAVATKPDLRFIPSLPGFESEWIPGCALEAIVLAECGIRKLESQSDFDNAASTMGFVGAPMNM